MSKSRWRVVLSFLGLLVSITSPAIAHSVQNEPSQVRIVARRDYLTIQITGDAVDWRDVTSNSAHQKGTSQSLLTTERQATADYATTHLVLEQGGRLLPLRVQKLEWKKLREGDDSSERIEMILRADRPAKLAASPLSVASDLFDNLSQTSTIVQLGDTEKIIQGAKTAEFSGASTFPTLSGDLTNFAEQGALESVTNIAQLLLLGTLFLASSLLPFRRLFWAVGALILGESLSFALCLTGHFSFLNTTAGPLLALGIAILSGISWRIACQGDTTGHLGGWPFIATVFICGLACGISYLAPLGIWGLPERGLPLCGMAFLVTSALAQMILGFSFWQLTTYFRRRFNQQAQYGGMNWPRAVQIASFACGVLGTYYGLR